MHRLFVPPNCKPVFGILNFPKFQNFKCLLLLFLSIHSSFSTNCQSTFILKQAFGLLKFDSDVGSAREGLFDLLCGLAAEHGDGEDANQAVVIGEIHHLQVRVVSKGAVGDAGELEREKLKRPKRKEKTTLFPFKFSVLRW